METKNNMPRKANSNHTPGDRANSEANGVWKLRLYVAGQSAKSVTAFANLKQLCEQHPEPIRRIVGDLTNADQTLVGLQLRYT